MQQRSEDTRARIQAAAAELFSRNGYDATGVAEICSLSGVSKGAFYHHYSSKQELFLSLMEGWLVGIENRVQINRTAVHDIPTVLAEIAGRSGDVFKTAGNQFRLILEFWTQASRKPEIWKAAIAPYRQYENFFSNVLAEGQKEGSLSQDFDPLTASRVIVGLAMGLLLQAMIDPEGADWDDVTRNGIGMMVEGIKRRP